MQGHVKVEVLTASGAVITSQEKDNAVLPTLDNFIDDLVKVYGGASGTIDSDIKNAISSFFGIDELLHPDRFGLVLYSDTKDTTSVNGVSSKKPLAKAGSTITPTATKGSLVSTNAILNAESIKIGNRMIWEFPTITANDTIASLGLTTREYCDNLSMLGLTGTAANPTFRYKTVELWVEGYYPSNPATPDAKIGCGMDNNYYVGGYLGRRYGTIDDDGDFMIMSESTLSNKRPKVVLGATKGPIIRYDKEILYSPPGWSDIGKVLDDGESYIIFGKNGDSHYCLAFVNKTTKLITETIALSCADSVTAYTDWGMCGDFVLLLGGVKSTGVPVLYALNKITNTQSIVTIPNLVGPNYFYTRSILTYKTVEGKYACDLFLAKCTPSSSVTNTINYYEVFESADGTSLLLNDEIGLATNDIATKPFPYMNVSLRPTCLTLCGMYASSSGSLSLSNYISFTMARRALFTLCNLETPIVKNPGQTLRVTYDLKWA